MPPHQVSEASDSRLSKFEARAVPTRRPRLVTRERPTHHEPEIEGGRGAPESLAGRTSRIRLLDADAAIHTLAQPAPSVSTGRYIQPWAKRALDVIGSLLLGLVFLPLMAIIVLMLRREGGPVIYRHRRIGQNGRPFECLKFRSMVPHADRVLRELLEEHPELRAEWVRDHKLRNDPRITATGRFLRRTSLDELPQIWNVLRGEMSLVGPRPVVREELMRYGRCLPTYLSAKPGITGLWQVTGRNDTDYRRRVALDVYYVRKQNLLLDLYILLKTTLVVLAGGGAY